MTLKQAETSASEGFVLATGGTTSQTVVIPPGSEPETLTVIDHILGALTNGTANGTYSMVVGGVTVLRKVIAGTVADYTDLDFGSGWPQWSSSGTDVEPYRYPDKLDLAPLTVYNVKGGTAGSGETEQAAGFSFTGTASTNYSCYGIMVRLGVVGRPNDQLNIDIGPTSITTAPTATSLNINAGSLIPGSQWVLFPLSSPITISGGTKYFLRLRRTGARDTNNYVTLDMRNDSSLANGGAYTLDNTTWSGESGTVDAIFRILAGLSISTINSAASTNSSLLVTYHYENPAHVRL